MSIFCSLLCVFGFRFDLAQVDLCGPLAAEGAESQLRVVFKCLIAVATYTPQGSAEQLPSFRFWLGGVSLRCVCAPLNLTFAGFGCSIYSEQRAVLARGAGHRPKRSAPLASNSVRGAGHRPRRSCTSDRVEHAVRFCCGLFFSRISE